MNALEEIERQLSESVAARAHDDTEHMSGATRRTRTARGVTANRLLSRRPAQLVFAVALAGVLLAVGLTNLSSTPRPTSAAAAALERLARIAASGPSLVPGPGQYLYVRSVSNYPANSGRCEFFAVDHRQLWIGADGSGLLRESSGPPTFTSPADQALCQKANPAVTGHRGTSNMWFASGCFTLGPTNDMRSLSTDPSTLLSQMRTIDGGPPTAAEDFVHIGDFLRETDASPALRAALYRAAALIPGVELLGTVPDHFGRQGLGVAFTSHGVRSELIFNSQTAALMGEQSTGSSFEANHTWAVYLDSSVVDSQPDPSPVPLTPPCIGTTGYVHDVAGGTVMNGAPVTQTNP